MPPSDFDLIFKALQDARVRYLVVGGVAVVLHGHLRFTADLDMVLALEPANVRAAMSALAGLGYRPRAPVSAEEFSDPEKRRQWVLEKGLTVFSLWSPEHPASEVDLFVEEPFPFDEAFARATRVTLGEVEVVVASIPDLVALKRAAGRSKDADDIAALQAIEEEVKTRG